MQLHECIQRNFDETLYVGENDDHANHERNQRNSKSSVANDPKCQQAQVGGARILVRQQCLKTLRGAPNLSNSTGEDLQDQYFGLVREIKS